MAKGKLTKAEYDALGADGQKSYELVGEVAYFTGEIPDVASLQVALDGERSLHQRATEQLKAYTGIDPVAAKAALAAAQGAAKGKEHDLTTKEGLQAALAEMRSDFETKLKDKDDQAKQMITDRTIESTLTKAGVIPKALPHAVDAVRKMVKPLGDDPAQLGVVGPQGSFIGTDFETWAASDFKRDSSFFFADSGAGGTGGNALNAQRGNAGAATKTRQEFDALSPTDKIAFSQQVDQGKAALVDSA